jgi:methionyl-tRNA formyltransferase
MVNGRKIAVFCYHFSHKKTQDFLLRLFLEGIKIEAIFASGWVDLKLPGSSLRTKIRHQALVHPQQIAARIGLGADYFVLPHNSADTVQIIKERGLDLGVIAGARILTAEVIDSFRLGIINFHPGLLPETRGLDALLWSVYEGLPLGVTAHLIDERVDAGTLISRETIPVYADDTFLDLQERLQEKEVEMLVPAINKVFHENVLKEKQQEELPARLSVKTAYHHQMTPELARKAAMLLPDYVQRFKEAGVDLR